MSSGPSHRTVLLAAAVYIATFATPTLAQHSQAERDLAHGEGLFLSACANCHGADGTGSPAFLIALPTSSIA